MSCDKTQADKSAMRGKILKYPTRHSSIMTFLARLVRRKPKASPAKPTWSPLGGKWGMPRLMARTRDRIARRNRERKIRRYGAA